MAVSLRDIARLAGVTRSTVSKGLRGCHDVSEKRAQEIRAIADRLGYRPNRAARMSVSKKTNTIGIVAGSLDNPPFLKCFMAMAREVEKSGFSALIQVGSGYFASTLEKAHELIDHRVDGLLINPVFDAVDLIESLRQRCNQIVAVSAIGKFPVPVVTHDYTRAGYLATTHLLGLGHRDIAYVITGLQGTRMMDRYGGYIQAMAEYGVKVDPNSALTCHDDIQESHRAFSQLLESGRRPTAVVCHTHLVTRGVFMACADKGLRIPEDLSIVDGDMGQYGADLNNFRPTCLDMHPALMGERAAQMLVDWLRRDEQDNPDWAPENCIIEPTLLPGDSTRQPRQGGSI